MKYFSSETRKLMSASQKKRWTPELRQKYSEMKKIKLPLNKVVSLYSKGWSMRKVGDHVGVSAQTICNFLDENRIEVRRPGQNGHWHGRRHHNWKDKGASYTAFHQRLNTRFGKPKKCSVCGTTDPSKIYEWANLTGKYFVMKDFARMCRKCHRRYDAKRHKETGRRTVVRLKTRLQRASA